MYHGPFSSQKRDERAMIGSSSMFKRRSRRWYAYILPAFVLLVIFLIHSGGWSGIYSHLFSTATKESSSTGSDCISNRPDFGGTVVIDTDEVVCGSLLSFEGTVAINGEVRGNVDAFGGTVVVAGTVDGNIDVYGGTLTMQNGSVVHGKIQLYGSRWFPGEGYQVDGAVITHPDTISWLIADMSNFSFPLWSMLVWSALGLMLIWLLPENVLLVRATAIQHTKRSFLIGLLSILLAPPVLMVLTALIIPIPLVVIIALALLAAWAFGTVVVGWVIGEHIVRAVAPRHNTRPVQVVVGLAALALLGSIPFIGWFINIVVGLIGLGAVFLSRFGTRLYGQPRKPLDI
jgi:hypothetical protein